MRLNKYIAQAGICSRRKADELTEAGKVKINGAICKELGYDVLETDRVEVEGKLVGAPEKHVYYALNKPLGYITTTSDEKNRPTAVSLLTDVTARVFPVGRLDADTTGLLILTNDGALANHIAHPRNKVFKTYIAVVNKMLSQEELWALRNGVDIGERFKTKPARVTFIEGSANRAAYEISISEGKNRQVRRMFKTVGATVEALQRVSIGDIKVGRLKLGGYRKLSPAEVEYLKNC